jgi:hypothetical protein
VSLLKLDRNVTNYLIRPHLGSPRKLHPGQKIHSSLMLSDKAKYTPKARPLNDDNFWDKGLKGLGDWLEYDLHEETQTLVKSLIIDTAYTGTALQTLRQTAMWGKLPQISRFSA